MLRTVFVIGFFALLGLFVLKLIFGIFPLLLGLIWVLAKMAFWILLIGFAIYFVIRIVSPDTARRIRSRWSGSSI
jgi:hypothetical protein